MSNTELKLKLQLLDNAIEMVTQRGAQMSTDAYCDLINERDEVLNQLIAQSAE